MSEKEEDDIEDEDEDEDEGGEKEEVDAAEEALDDFPKPPSKDAASDSPCLEAATSVAGDDVDFDFDFDLEAIGGGLSCSA